MIINQAAPTGYFSANGFQGGKQTQSNNIVIMQLNVKKHKGRLKPL